MEFGLVFFRQSTLMRPKKKSAAITLTGNRAVLRENTEHSNPKTAANNPNENLGLGLPCGPGQRAHAPPPHAHHAYAASYSAKEPSFGIAQARRDHLLDLPIRFQWRNRCNYLYPASEKLQRAMRARHRRRIAWYGPACQSRNVQIPADHEFFRNKGEQPS